MIKVILLLLKCEQSPVFCLNLKQLLTKKVAVADEQ